MKYKVVVIDPHSSLEEDIGGLENTKVIDFESKKNSIDLFMNSKENIVSESEVLLTLFKSLMDKEYNSKLERVLRHSIYLLICIENVSLNNLRDLITDSEFRNKIISKYKAVLPESILNFFLKDFNDLKNKSHQEAISPIVSFIDEMTIFPVFSNNTKLQSIEEVIKNNFLSIISLNEAVIGEKTTKTISGLVMGQIFNLIQKRCIDEHIIFIIDEVAIIQNPIIKRFLSSGQCPDGSAPRPLLPAPSAWNSLLPLYGQGEPDTGPCPIFSPIQIQAAGLAVIFGQDGMYVV